jgi:hypothetical protein
MSFTIDDIRKFVSNIYQWMTTNADLDFIKMSIDDCYSDAFSQRRIQLGSALQKTRTLLTKLSESIDEMEGCIIELKISIERERQIRKNANAKRKNKI